MCVVHAKNGILMMMQFTLAFSRKRIILTEKKRKKMAKMLIPFDACKACSHKNSCKSVFKKTIMTCGNLLPVCPVCQAIMTQVEVKEILQGSKIDFACTFCESARYTAYVPSEAMPQKADGRFVTNTLPPAG